MIHFVFNSKHCSDNFSSPPPPPTWGFFFCLRWSDGMSCCRSDWLGVGCFVVIIPCVLSELIWAFLFHINFPMYSFVLPPPPPTVNGCIYCRGSYAWGPLQRCRDMPIVSFFWQSSLLDIRILFHPPNRWMHNSTGGDTPVMENMNKLSTTGTVGRGFDGK